MLVQVLFILLVTWMLVWRWQNRSMYKLWKQLKNDVMRLPLIGHAYLFIGNDEDRMKVFQRFGVEAYKYGGLFALWQVNRLYINVSDPEIAEYLLKTCLEKDDVLKVSRMLTGNGSVFAPVPIWRPRRKFLAPTFSPKNLVQFLQIFRQQSSILVEQLQAAAGQGTFSIWKYITSYSMDSVCESTLGVKVNAQREPDTPFLKAFEELCKLDSARFCQPWLHNNTVYKMTSSYRQYVTYRAELCRFIDQVIQTKRQDMKKDETPIKSEHNNDSEAQMKLFLELLIETSGEERGFTDLELQEETLVLVLAGTDTSAVGTSFTAVMLSLHQEIPEKVYQELQEVFNNTDRPIQPADLTNMRYLDAVVRESLRLYPPVPIIARKALKDLPLSSGMILAKNCGIVINIWAIHRNPKYWGEDAMVFRPERWIESSLPHPAAFIPFSYGPRGCVGYRYAMMSMKTAIASILRHYRLHPASPELDKHAPLRTRFDVMMKHVDNFQVKIEKRHK